jgi:gag-polypeptide of LTR copia-type
MDPSLVWERLASLHMSQGLGSIISMWQRFVQLKKLEGVTVQAHAASIREHPDRLTSTGLGDLPSETLMIAVLLLSLPESYGSLVSILILIVQSFISSSNVASMRKHVSFLTQAKVQNSLQVRIPRLMLQGVHHGSHGIMVPTVSSLISIISCHSIIVYSESVDL